ncbi:TonB-dependent receptor [Rheinheimera baltica]|uniref:TonB-dependent receptor n=3 Tax=Rheinheimera baltica TaxID=67576 RepID=A0ABT9I4N6_9GAMM|nr:TonB-dependent receptor [Rheinheimera baltica]MDP5138366.1 TonB-dependent receptor [Rheinheimera baltica]
MKTKFFKNTLTAVAVAASLGATMSVSAQDASRGNLLGQAQDQSGQVISDVQITVTNLETGLVRSVTSGENGNFRFPLLPPGAYSLQATKSGYGVVAEKSVNVRVGGNTNMNITLLPEGTIESIEVRGSRVAMLDAMSTESQLVVSQEFLSKIPVPRDLASVALLAPGTTKGDSAFGNLASFGGSSVGENAYYVNGLNVTNFRNGLGGSELPFEMYETFEVKTGGYSAEFGRSTGGVINAKTKSGSNDFHAGGSVYLEPSSMRAHRPDVILTDADAIDENGSPYYIVNSNDEISENNVNAWASGAIVQDKLFFFGLVNYKTRTSDYSTDNLFYDRSASDVLYAGKLDWYITPNHILEFTGWDNSSDLDTSKYGYDFAADTREELYGDYVLERGGKSYGLQYTGIISDDLTVSALYGVNKATYSNVNVGDSVVGVAQSPSGIQFSQYGLATPSVMEDKRTAYRVDVDWFIHEDHALRFGFDYEDLEATEDTSRVGGTLYQYRNCTNSDAVSAGNLLDADCARVRFNTYVNAGAFQTKSNAYYIQDTWQVTDNITARIGLRNETFENYNKAGDKFVDVTDQWAPRVGVSWDINGDGESKVFANYGRYFLPVATNTNIRLAGDELYTITLYDVIGINGDLTPVVDENAPLSVTTYADGTLKSTLETVNADIEPMYQDEFILGYERMLSDNWTFGVKGTYRELKSSLEDIAIDYGFNEYLEQEFGSSCTNCTGFHYYVLTNPGGNVTLTTDPDGDGPLANQAYTVPADLLGYPTATRQYGAVDFNVRRAFDVWMIDATYTWSHSWGNSEGFVRSDNGQDDAGLTTNFDQPGLVDGANGNLPNDRRHMVKIQGAYALTEQFSLGANFRWESGRPLSSFGFHPTDAFASLYEAESFVKDGQLVSRGSQGRTASNWTLDLTARYEMKFNGADIVLRGDVFNVFNNMKVTERNEINEIYAGDRADGGYAGTASALYGLPDAFQSPRSVRLSAEVKF